MQAMSVYKHHASWWVRFRDPQNKPRKFRASKSKRVADVVSRKLLEICEHATAGSPLPDDLAEWVHALDPARRKKLVEWGMIREKRIAGATSLLDQVEEWHNGLLNRGRDKKYASMKKLRALALINGCGFERWSDFEAEKVLQQIQTWREDKKVPGFKKHTDVSEVTLQHYLAALKQFCKWAVASGYTFRHPLEHVQQNRRSPRPDHKSSNMAKRRALNDLEQQLLVEYTPRLPHRYSMPSELRALVYHTALRTGLRQSAIRRLVKQSVRSTGRLHATSAGAANKKTTGKPISGKLLEQLVEHADSLPDFEPPDSKHPEKKAPTRLFALPSEYNMARMLRADCRDIRKLWIREASGAEQKQRRQSMTLDQEGVDFHCLRHSFGTSMARRGVHPKTLMALMDHSDINVTMGLYTHSMPEDEVSAIELLPELGEAQPRHQMRHQGA